MFNLEKTEVRNLLELIHMGNEMVNSFRSSDKLLKCYNDVYIKVLEKYVDEYRNDENFDELVEDLTQRTEVFIQDYGEKIMPSIISKLLADRKYPENSDENCAAREIYEDELELNGEDIIDVNIQDFENKMEHKMPEKEKLMIGLDVSAIKALLKRDRRTWKDFSEMCNITCDDIVNMLSDKQVYVTMSQLRLIARYFGMDQKEFLSYYKNE